MTKDVRGVLPKVISKQHWIVQALLVILVVMIIYRIIKNFKVGTTVAGDLAAAPIIFAQTGITPSRQQVCRDVAKECNSAIKRVFGAIIWITHDDVVNNLNRLVTEKEAALTSEFYNQESGESLKSAIEGGRFDFGKRSRINSVIRENLH